MRTQHQGNDDRDKRERDKNQPNRDDRPHRHEPAHNDETELDPKPGQTDPPIPGRTPVQIRGAVAAVEP